MSDHELAPGRVVLGERNYEEATALLLAEAKRELKIFDPDLTRGGYQGARVFELLKAFLARDRLNRITIILHEERFLLGYCPRLIGLMQHYSHAMTVYLTDDSARVAQDAFILADSAAYLHRFHIDHARFRYVLNDVEAARPLHERFDQLLEATRTRLSADTVGL
ncbi:MAG TPA: hypothetical protein VIK69_05560 [Methylophilaceae bacterium]|jgi:hypothetical protein